MMPMSRRERSVATYRLAPHSPPFADAQPVAQPQAEWPQVSPALR
jgi:hypothetical protein